MRKYINILLCFCLIFALSSCKDWLTVGDEDILATDDYWKNKEDVEAVVNSGYYNLRSATKELLHWGEARGPGLEIIALDGQGANENAEKVRLLTVNPSNDLAKWGSLYKVISRANAVIKYAPGVMEADDTFYPANYNSMMAEAYFQRALAYFYIARVWGDAPYITEPYVTDDVSYDIAKSDQEFILRSIFADLKVVIDNDWAKEYYDENQPQYLLNTKGRATRWAVNALYADIALWLEEWDECIAAADRVINSGRVGLIQGELWFDNFGTDNATIHGGGNSNEGIFEIQFSNALNQTGSVRDIFYGSTPVYGISDYAMLQIRDMRNYGADVRGFGGTYIGYYGVVTANSSFYYYPVYKRYGASWGTGISRSNNDQNYIIYRLADVYLMKAEALIMKNQFDDAMEIINIIRDRALCNTHVTASVTQEENLRTLLDERILEFVGEGKCWFDILRVGRYNNYQYKDLFIDYAVLAVGASNQDILRTKLMDNNSHYLPVPSEDLKNNSLLTQNPYYESLGN